MPHLISAVIPSGRLAAQEQPVLKTEGGLVLRPFTPQDADVLVETFADPAILRWHTRTVVDAAEAVELIASYGTSWAQEKSATWAITEGPHVLGRVALLFELAHGCAQVTYWATPSARGRGAVPDSV